MEELSSTTGALVEIGLWLGYILVLVAAIGALVIPIAKALMIDPKSLIKSVLSVVALLVLFGIGYAFAGNEVTKIYEDFKVDASLSKMIGGAIIMMYVLLVVAVGGVVFNSFAGMFKS